MGQMFQQQDILGRPLAPQPQPFVPQQQPRDAVGACGPQFGGPFGSPFPGAPPGAMVGGPGTMDNVGPFPGQLANNPALNNALTGCIPPVLPIRAADRFCPMVIPLDTGAKVIPGGDDAPKVCFEVDIDCIFRLCTLRIPSNVAQCLVVESIVIRKTEQLGCGGDGEGALSGTFFSELATCCYCIACDLAWPSDSIKVCVRNIGNADFGNSETGKGIPGLVALVGEGLDFSQCAPFLFQAVGGCY